MSSQPGLPTDPLPGAMRGVIAPLLTPFTPDGAPDRDAFTAFASNLLDDGCTGLAPFGTTSEANSLTLDERRHLLEALIDSAGIAPGRLMPGTGHCALGDAVTLTRHAADLGVTAALVLPPFYYKGVSDDGLFAFFSGLIEGVGERGFGFYLYHIPQVSQVPISLDLLERLCARYPNAIRGVKDSSGDWDNTRAMITGFRHLHIFSGSELTLLDNLRAGGAGCISATANVNAKALRAVLDAFDGGAANVDDLQEAASQTRRTIQSAPVIPLLKEIVARRTGHADWASVRPPLVGLEAAVTQAAFARLEGQLDLAPAI